MRQVHPLLSPASLATDTRNMPHSVCTLSLMLVASLLSWGGVALARVGWLCCQGTGGGAVEVGSPPVRPGTAYHAQTAMHAVVVFVCVALVEHSDVGEACQ